ncbi:MAG: hypothetical protein QOF78_577 [Phycisphaerales bacterium]|jgi:prepilin-type N-terminal cleavage/methylation domain-containing protein/prepilin-type processing-associated H-X9-DG protein|nr:hypothetical protein [Phycisphaerales bacterium]
MNHVVAPVSHPRAKAFTLVELLVVIGIIAILVGILLPTLSSARKAGYKTKCLASLHQIGDAFKMYQIDNKGAWPVSVHFYNDGGEKDKRWHDFISKYVISPQTVTDPATGTKYSAKELNPNGTMGFPGHNNHQMEFGSTTDPVWIGTLRDRDNVLWGCPTWRGSYNLINNADDYRIPGYTMNRFAQSPNDLDAAGNLIQNRVAYICTNPNAGSTFNGAYLKMTAWKNPGDRILIYEGVHPVGYFAALYLKAWPYAPEKAGGPALPAVPDSSNFPVDYNRHGKKRVGNTSTDPSLNVLYCDGHCGFVSAIQAYKAMRMN